MNFSNQINVNDKYVLRKLTLNDAETIFNNYAQDEKVLKYLTFSKHQSINDTISYLNDAINNYSKNIPTSIELGIFEKNNLNDIIGSVSIRFLDVDKVEFGYLLKYDYQNKHIMTNLINFLIDYLSKNYSIKKFIITCNVNNIASNKVAINNGFYFLKKEQKEIKKDNKIYLVNTNYYMLVRE